MTDTLETKGSGGEAARALDELLEAFESFKATNDQRLDEIERRSSADPLTEEKLARIEATLDATKALSEQLAVKAGRPRLDGAAGPSHHGHVQHKAAFESYVRSGDVRRLATLEEKALSSGSGPDGGYLVPAETEATVNRALRAISPIRAIAGVRQVSGAVYKRPFATTGTMTGWAGEAAPRPETDTPVLAELQFPTMELYAMPAASSALLEDSIVDIDAWLAEEVRLAFAEQEGTAFVIGDGVNKPRGFTTYPTVDNSVWSWGNLGTVSTGAAGAFPATDAGDTLLDLIYAAKAPYRANGTFVMNRATQATVRKLKDAQGNYMWQPAANQGEAPTLLGYPVAEAEDMPDIAAGALAIAFGDFSRGYLIVDRAGIRVLRDPYSAKPHVLFYTTKRVGGGVQDFDAIKFLKFEA